MGNIRYLIYKDYSLGTLFFQDLQNLNVNLLETPAFLLARFEWVGPGSQWASERDVHAQVQ
jgi:hypothetical protein